MLRPYKFVVQAIPQQVDAEGNVVGEAETQPVTLFGCDALEQWARDFPAKLADAEARATASAGLST